MILNDTLLVLAVLFVTAGFFLVYKIFTLR